MITLRKQIYPYIDKNNVIIFEKINIICVCAKTKTLQQLEPIGGHHGLLAP
jgi:hypothetical protein